MTPGERPTVRGYALPLVAALLSAISLSLLFGGRGVFFQANSAGAGVLTESAAPNVLYLPAGAHAAGANGASWRTDVEVHNPGSSTASFTVQLLRQGADNSSPASHAYTLAAGRSRRFADVLVSEFGFEGAAALRVSVTSGTLVMTSRTYNLLGANPWSLPMGASFGLFEPGMAESDALSYGQEGRLIQLTQQPSSTLDGFRTNVGIVNTTAIPIDVRVEFYRADGTYLGKKDGGDTNLPPYGFRQLNEVFNAWGTVADGYAIAETTTPGGGLIAFATVIDNHNSGDPIFIPAAKVAGSGAPPTPTPTPTSGGNLPDLVPYRPLASEGQPQDWEGPIVPDYQPGTYTTSFLSSHMTTYVKWAVANLGAADVTGTVRFELQVDGQPFSRWFSDTGLRAGYYITVKDFQIPYDTIPPGAHTLSIVADPDGEIAESNETNNSWSKSWTWTSIVFSRSPGQRPPLSFGGRSVPEARIDAAPLPVAVEARSALAAAATEPIYVPASAHASGLNGSNWRTDLEVHNPGAAAVSYTIALLKQSTDNGGTIPTRTFSLGPQQSVRYVDVLSTVFSTDGAAALRVTPQSGALLVNSRTYNLIGANSVGLPVGASFGQFVPGLAESEAIGPAEEGRVIQLTHRDASTLVDFRSNVGFANTTASPIDLRIDLMRADGGLLATIQDERTHLRAYESKQINGIFGGATSWLDDGYVVVRSATSAGRFFAFATVIDNHLTGDPIFVPAVKTARSALPPPTPTPSPSPTATPTPSVTPPAGGAPVTTSTSGSTVTVTQAGTLKDLGFTFPGAPPGGFTVSSVLPAQAPQIPSGVTRLSDFFQTSAVVPSGGMVTLTLPVAALPAGRLAKDLRLYAYTDAAQDVKAGGSISGMAWIRTWYDLNVLANGKATIKLQGLGALSFIGIEAPVAAVTSSPESVMVKTRRGALAVTVSCQPKALPNGTSDANQQVCTAGYAVGKSFTVTVKNLGDLHLTPAATLNELVGWLGAARLAFDNLGLSSDATFEAEVGAMPVPNALGYVTSRDLEDRRVLHITNAPESKNAIQGTAVHEYFHHAQSRTKEAGKTNLLDTNHAADWVTEGLARWFEDDLFDSLNTYTLKEGQPLGRILEVGLGAAPDNTNERARAYARFAFWKMVQSKCSGFSIPQILNANLAGDPRGVANFRTRIESALWQCDFGGGLGDANRATLANALLEYTFATVKNDDISLLDSNEPNFNFVTVDGLFHIAPKTDCIPDATCAGAFAAGTIPPGGASAFVVDAVLSPPDGMISTLWLTTTPGGGDALLWVGEAEQLMASPSAGKWAAASEGGAVPYGQAGLAPKALAVLLNPSPTEAVTISVRAGYGSALTILSESFTEPLIDWGRPQKDYGFEVYGPANSVTTRYLWSFGDGTAKVTVDGSAKARHTFTKEGAFSMSVELSDRSSGARLGSAQATARIGWFHGSFQVTGLTETSSSGTITWEELEHPEEVVFTTILGNPSAGRVEFNYLSAGNSVWLQTGDFLAIAGTGNDTVFPPDMPNFMTANGAQLAGRALLRGYIPLLSQTTYATHWFDTTLTQSGAALTGVLTQVYRKWNDTIQQPVEVGRKSYRLTAQRRE